MCGGACGDVGGRSALTRAFQTFAAPSFDDKILEVVAVFGSMQMAVSRVIKLQHHRIAQVPAVVLGAGRAWEAGGSHVRRGRGRPRAAASPRLLPSMRPGAEPEGVLGGPLAPALPFPVHAACTPAPLAEAG